MTERNLNLANVPAEEALSKYFSALSGFLKPGAEIIPAEESLERVTCSPVLARLSCPHYNASAMDGIAVKSASTSGASESNPVTLKIGEDFVYVNTGDPVCPPYDAVIMIEYVVKLDDERVQIKESASSMLHIRPIGENVAAGNLILKEKHKIRPVDISVLLSGGVKSVEVFTKPRVAIFPTGSELIDLSALMENENPEEGKIIESNTRMFEAQVKQAGAEGTRFAPVPDNHDLLKEAVTKAAQNYDMVLINAGSSAGTEDYTVRVLRDIGEVIVHGVAMKPGKPIILAIVNGKPVIGTPGYPVSAYISFETFVLPVLSVLTGRRNTPRQKIEAVLSKSVSSSIDRREYVRVKLEDVNGKLTASPLARHSGAAMSLVQADGFCIIEQGCDCIEAGAKVIIELIN